MAVIASQEVFPVAAVPSEKEAKEDGNKEDGNRLGKNQMCGFKNIIARYGADKNGVVTIEWVAIAAVVVVASILISSAILNSADGFAGAVVGQLDTATNSISN